jgi:hypothetical protein
VLSDFRVLGEMNQALISFSPLVRLINNILEIQKTAPESEGCNIKWNAPAEVYIKTDREVLERALSKILTKAICACPRGETLELDFMGCLGAVMLRLSYPGQNNGVSSPIAFETDPDWALAEAMIRLLGGALEIHGDYHRDSRTCVDVTLSLREPKL